MSYPVCRAVSGDKYINCGYQTAIAW